MRGRRYVELLALLVTLLTAVPLGAQPAPVPPERSWLRQSESSTRVADASPKTSLGKWLAAATLAGLTGFVFWRRKQQIRSNPVVAASQIKIAGVTKLSPKAQLIVATVNGRSMLLGVTDAAITRIMWLDAAADSDAAFEDTSDDSNGTADETSAPTTAFGRGPLASNDLLGRKATATSRAHPVHPSTRQRSRFGELLADAIGLGSQKSSARRASPQAPVDDIAAGTVDRYVRAASPTNEHPRTARAAVPAGALINVEGQAAGLVARLNRHQS